MKCGRTNGADRMGGAAERRGAGPSGAALAWSDRRWVRCPGRARGPWVPPRLLVRRWFRRLADGLQLLPPLRGLVSFLQSVVELHQALQGVGEGDIALWWDLRPALLHALVARQEQRLGVGVHL